MPQISQWGFSGYTKTSLEDEGFSRTHRRDGVDLEAETVEVQQEFPDWAFSTDKIEELNVSKLRAGSLRVDEYMQSTGFVTGSTGWQITGDGDVEFNSGTFRGSLVAGSIHIPDVDTTASSFHTDSSGNSWWGCTQTSFTSSPTNANAYILKTGIARFASVTITGGSIVTSALNGIIAQGNLNLADRGWSQTSAFSVTDADTVAWGAGTFTSADGTAYSISGGNTGNMVAKTYIYLDSAVSTTAYQTTVVPTTAVGAGKVLIAIAQNGTVEPTFTVLDGQGGQNIDASSIVANSITANELSTSIIYAGAITIDTAGNIHSGQSSYDSGVGWFLGNVAGTPKFSIGDSSNSSKKMTWDGTNLTVNDSVLGFQDIFGDGSDGDVTISSNTTLTRDMFYNNLTIDVGFTLNTGGFRVHVKGTLTINGTIGRPGTVGTAGTAGSTSTTLPTKGSGGAGGTALADGSIKGAVAGGAGANGGDGSTNNNDSDQAGSNSTNGGTVAKSLTNIAGTQGGTGGQGGVASDGGGSNSNGSLGGATPGTVGTITGTVFNLPRTAFSFWLLQDFFPSNAALTGSSGSVGGCGGGGGASRRGGAEQSGGGGGGGGGGAGSPGGITAIYAKKIVIGATGVISAVGGAGGAGGAAGNGAIAGGAVQSSAGGGGGGGGGAGGSGGAILLAYSSLTNSGSITAAGGAAGTFGAAGTGASAGPNPNWTGGVGTVGVVGSAGNTGVVIQLVI